MKNRNGGYKKILLNPRELEAQNHHIQTNIAKLKELKLADQDFTTLYILLFLRLKHPHNYLQTKPKSRTSTTQPKLLDIIPVSFELASWEKQKLYGQSGEDLFSHFNLKSIPFSINRAMMNWYQGRWKLIRIEHIPSPKELLTLQTQNARFLTTLTLQQEPKGAFLIDRDPLSFVLHDLMHADQFFNQPETIQGQLGFYKRALALYKHEEVNSLLKKDPQFKKEFEYVTSDMNAYVIHLFKCLKSAIMRTEKNHIFFEEILSWWGMNEQQVSASKLLNTPQFSLQEELCLKQFFEKSQEIFL